ncbi:MAG: ACP S-malonyltransferase [Rhodospirillaceae bacterium]|jgi:[acyl-carrier-protein] S-malonyltransferase|nr:ACP S-malonyltransferase [Rhodospirillaceae bacterium]
MTVAFVFPGQGSQAVGMGRDLAEAFPAARHVFEEVDDALDQKLSKVMFEGPEETLVLTENAQPALMAVSMAVMRVLAEEGDITLADKAAFVAGHSLGEYSALAAASAISLGDAARLLKLRGQSMQKAVPVGVGAMAAIIGPELDAVRNIATEAAAGDVCDVGNDNAPGQVVLSGDKAAVERAVKIAADQGVRRSIMLPVSAPFHCALMKPAADAMEKALADIELQAPVVPVVANVTAEAVRDPAIIRELLVRQVTEMVRWRECVLYMKDQGVDTLLELGAGKVLGGLTRRIDREMTGRSVQGPDDIEELLKSL